MAAPPPAGCGRQYNERRDNDLSSAGAWVVAGGILALLVTTGRKAEGPKAKPPAPVFLRENDGYRWTVRNGITVSLQPDPLGAGHAPRGLIRIGLPLRPGEEPRLLNFVAVEPVTMDGWRGLSELEISPTEHKNGLAMWFDKPVETKDFVRLTIRMDRFANGAHPYVVAELRKDRPNEVRFEVYAEPDSAPMRQCILTSTMGNYQRLRRLYLKDRVVTAQELFPEPLGQAFARHAVFPLAEMTTNAEGAYADATGDEKDPRINAEKIAFMDWWAFRGLPFIQYWRQPNPVDKDLRVAVNAREIYYGQTVPIPGGKSFENFELSAGFYPGQTFIFGVRLPEDAPPGAWR